MSDEQIPDGINPLSLREVHNAVRDFTVELAKKYDGRLLLAAYLHFASMMGEDIIRGRALSEDAVITMFFIAAREAVGANTPAATNEDGVDNTDANGKPISATRH